MSTKEQVMEHVATLRKMAEEYNEIGPVDLIDHLELDEATREQVLDELFGAQE